MNVTYSKKRRREESFPFHSSISIFSLVKYFAKYFNFYRSLLVGKYVSFSHIFGRSPPLFIQMFSIYLIFVSHGRLPITNCCLFFQNRLLHFSLLTNTITDLNFHWFLICETVYVCMTHFRFVSDLSWCCHNVNLFCQFSFLSFFDSFFYFIRRALCTLSRSWQIRNTMGMTMGTWYRKLWITTQHNTTEEATIFYTNFSSSLSLATPKITFLRCRFIFFLPFFSSIFYFVVHHAST